jgi:O-antigen/teichoic acid export membrane protein
VLAGLRLSAIMVGLDVGLLLVGLSYLALDLSIAPQLRRRPTVARHLLRPLFVFGGWISVSSVVVPVLVYADRLLLSALASVAVLAYYTVPYELVSRLQVVPWSFGTALFPAFSASATATAAELSALYARSLKYLYAVMSPLALAVLVGANPILTVWLGSSFAARGAIVMQLLAVGMLLNALSQIPAHLLDAIGRPDLRAQTFLSYTPVYLGLAWYLIATFGVTGAALAWTLRGALELCLFFGVAWRVRGLGLNLLLHNRTLPALGAFALFAGAGYGLAEAFAGDRLLGAAVTAVVVLAFSAALWNLMLDRAERSNILSIVWNLFNNNQSRTRTQSESTV